MRPRDSESILQSLYTVADILACCPGMGRKDIYYLEQRGYVKPLKQRHGRVERNLFTSEQAELVCVVWKYRKTGLSPRDAYGKALKERTMGQLSLWENP